MAVATEQREVSLAGAVPPQKTSNFDYLIYNRFHSMGIWLFVHASFFLKESTRVIIKETPAVCYMHLL
jgi:hypothetical protein